MKRRGGCAVLVTMVCLTMMLGVYGTEVYGSSTGNQSEEISGLDKSDPSSTEIAQELLSEIELTDVQNMLDELLGEDSFSVKEALIRLTKGEQAFSKEAVQEVVYRFFFYRLDQEKGLFAKLLLLILFAAVFSSFADVFENEQIGNISFLSSICWFLRC